MHDFMTRSNCAVTLQLSCLAGCDAFLTSRERRLLAQNTAWSSHWHAQLNRSGFCAPLDGEAQFCRLRRPVPGPDGEPPLELPECCLKSACIKPASLMKRAYSKLNMQRALQLINESKRFGGNPNQLPT